MPLRRFLIRRLGLALLASALLPACRLTGSVATPAPPIADSQTAPAGPTATVPTGPTVTPRACLDSAASSATPELPPAQAAAIVDYLNRGGAATQLVEPLAGDTAALDFDGDGLLDLALVSNSEPNGKLFVFHCASDRYELAYTEAELESPGAATIRASQDLTGDQLDDLLVSRQECGAHTCSARVEALAWIDSRLSNRLTGDTSDLPSPLIEWDQGSAEIHITATGINSVGAGPFRMFRRSWVWNSDGLAFIPQPDELLPSDYRIHLLHDADDAAANGNLDGALALYQQVIDDPELDNWVAGELGQQQLAAYARFRRMITILQIGDLELAEQALQELQLERAPGAGFAALGEAFWAAFAGANGGARPPSPAALAAGCRAAAAYSLTHSEETLDLLYYGYANRSYRAESICPFGSGQARAVSRPSTLQRAAPSPERCERSRSQASLAG